MALHQQVGKNIDAFRHETLAEHGGGTQTIPISCHLATNVWLFREYRQIEPDLFDVADSTAVVTAISKIATLQKRSSFAVAPGTVVIFMASNGPAHSCTAKSQTMLGGYNNRGWFSSKGEDHDYSEHTPTHVQWCEDGTTVKGYNEKIYEIWTASESKVRKAYLQSIGQKSASCVIF
jgi:hypothetical protein